MKLRDALIFRLLAGIITGIAIGIVAAHCEMTALLRAVKTAEERERTEGLRGDGK